MATEAQVCANRSNARKSTGPRTEEGKAAVAQNAVKHGLLARAAVLQGEDWEEYTCFHEEMMDELYPDSMMEEELAERIVDLTWRLRRAGRYQDAVFEALYDQYAAAPAEPSARPDPLPSVPSDPVLGRMLLADFSGDRVLERVLVYERRIESSLYRTMAELRRLRQERRKEGQKVRRSEGPALSPSFVPTFSRSSPERQACETNPIPVEAGEDWGFCITKAENVGRGRPTHEEAPCRVGTNTAEVQGQSCETKPISGGLADRPAALRAAVLPA